MTQPSGPAIRADGLTKRFGETVAVDGLDLRIDPGTVFGFLGPNGAGKTTTMQLLTTLLEPTAGDAWIAGEHVRNREAVRSHVGYLPETPPVYDELTGREQLEYVLALEGLDATVADSPAMRRVEAFGLADALDDRIETYSKGMKQKLGLAGVLVGDPDIVFLDEPTSGLDPRAARTVREIIADLAAAEVTVFLSTHILSVVEELADRVGVLADGRLVADDAPEALIERVEADGEDGTLEDVFLEVTADRRRSAAPA